MGHHPMDPVHTDGSGSLGVIKSSTIALHSLAELELDEVFLPVHNPHTAVHLHLREGVKTQTVEDSRPGTSAVLHLHTH